MILVRPLGNFRGANPLWLLLLLCSLFPGAAQEWPRFRGPNGSGISTAKTIPTSWTEKDYNWKLPLAGAGHSSPVLWGDRIFLTTGDAQTRQTSLVAVSATSGRVQWEKSAPFKPYHKNSNNTFASASPTVDEHRVFVCWTSPESCTVMALSHEGQLIWERDLGPFASQHGGGASPIVYQNKVILGKEQDGEGFLIALEAGTGKALWQVPRQSKEAVYATPCVYEPTDGPPALIFNSHAYGISAVDPGTGKELWAAPDVFDKRVVSSPVLAAGLILGSCGSGGGGNYLVAVRPGLGAKKAEVAYKVRQSAPYVPTSVCGAERLFLWSDGGVVSCLDAASGELRWQERVGGNFFSSPVWVDGRLFCVSTKGEVVVVSAGERFELLARNPLGEAVHSTPAIAGGRMYIHTTKSLISVGGRTNAQSGT
jgi:outer membrane protein assembly factor BamB